jgi:hypothetical protein
VTECTGFVAIDRELLVEEHQLSEQLDLLDLIVGDGPHPPPRASASMRSISASTRAIAARVAAENGFDLSCANSKGIAVHITGNNAKANPADNSNARMHDRTLSP